MYSILATVDTHVAPYGVGTAECPIPRALLATLRQDTRPDNALPRDKTPLSITEHAY